MIMVLYSSSVKQESKGSQEIGRNNMRHALVNIFSDDPLRGGHIHAEEGAPCMVHVISCKHSTSTGWPRALTTVAACRLHA